MSEPHTVSRPVEPVFLCSPFRGLNAADRARNIEYAKAAMLDCLERGEAPFVPHLLYPTVLDDSVEVDRKRGIEAGFAFLARATRVVVYVDCGMSEGMQSELVQASRLGIRIEHRKLEGWAV